MVIGAARAPELKVEVRIEQGSPAKKITELAENERFDLII
jgi:nucleotide-binding universal stress UspA family protein